ncbi:MAG: hypothetical protein K2N74_06295, partial [Clostridiales bacterium]|nr:hypothetical protein [Clostridiales bacterium]
IYTHDIAASRLTALAIPFVNLIGLILCGVIFPLYDVKAKRAPEDGIKLLLAKKPTGGEGEEYEAANARYNKLAKIRLIVWCSALAVTLGCVIAELVYLLNTSHFKSENITAEILAMVKNVLPWVAVSFAVLVAAAVANGIIARKQLAELKTLIKTGNKQAPGETQSKLARIISVLSSDIALWVVRGVVFVVAVTFIILGALNGGAHDVLVKAINICTECIGLG